MYSHSEGSWGGSSRPRMTPESDGTGSSIRNYLHSSSFPITAAPEEQANQWDDIPSYAATKSSAQGTLGLAFSRLQSIRPRATAPVCAEVGPPFVQAETIERSTRHEPTFKLKRKRRMSPARVAKAKQVRREKPCVRCKMYKEGVSTFTPALQNELNTKPIELSVSLQKLEVVLSDANVSSATSVIRAKGARKCLEACVHGCNLATGKIFQMCS